MAQVRRIDRQRVVATSNCELLSCLSFCTSAFDDDVLRRCPNTTTNSSGLSRWAGHLPIYQRTISDQLHQLKDEARAIERRLREALAAVAEQEAIMRADEGEKHRAELRRQEYSKQWSKDDDKLRSLERSVRVFAPESCVSLIIAPSCNFPLSFKFFHAIRLSPQLRQNLRSYLFLSKPLRNQVCPHRVSCL